MTIHSAAALEAAYGLLGLRGEDSGKAEAWVNKKRQ